MQSYKGRFDPTRFEDLTVTIDFRCHSACRFCIVQEGMNYFKGVPLERFRAVVADNTKAPRYRRVTFTGGEVSLDKSLFDYLAVARESGSFDHIRIQTNGRPMADEAFTQKLVDAGVDEFFVSLHGADAKTQDYISQREGSFDEAMRGLANLRKHDVVVMTNTVLTTLNAHQLPEIVETVRHIAPTRMEFWYYLPMEDYADERGLLPTMEVLIPPLKAAIGRAKAYGFGVAVKYVPQCLLGEHGDVVDNTQPDVVIVEDFYDVYPQFACLYEAKCEHSESCLGLHYPYIEKYGWEKDALTPVARTTPWREPEYGLSLPSDDPGGQETERTDQPTWRHLVEGVAEAHDMVLASVVLDRRRCIYRFESPDSETSVDLVLTARSMERKALARSASFNMHYRNVFGDPTSLQTLLRAAIDQIRARDGGELMLDERKGLVGPDAFRRPRK